MRWHKDNSGAEWTATVCEDAQIRILRRTLEKPYREGEAPNERYVTFEFNDADADAFAGTIRAACLEARGE